MKTLVIRADADGLIGTGHVMRCLALAQAWQDAGGTVRFLVRDLPAGLRQRLAAENVPVEDIAAPRSTIGDAQECADVLRRAGGDWLVVDGYHFDEPYQRILKNEGVRFLYVDDLGHLDRYHADLVLNQNIYASEELYGHACTGCDLLLGPRYALLRREFVRHRDWQREIPAAARRILVTCGGADPDNVAGHALAALKKVAEGIPVELRLVVGPANPHLEILCREVMGSSLDVEVREATPDMPGLMMWADLAIAAAGTTAWELCFFGLPGILICLSDNQVRVAEGVGRHGAAINAGWHSELKAEVLARKIRSLAEDEPLRRGMSQAGRSLVDGLGAARLVKRMSDGEVK